VCSLYVVCVFLLSLSLNRYVIYILEYPEVDYNMLKHFVFNSELKSSVWHDVELWN